jgi:hypothetical protein
MQEKLLSNGVRIISFICEHLSGAVDRDGKKLRDRLVIRNLATCFRYRKRGL